MTIGNEIGRYKCFCVWDFPNERAYFWFRLIAGNAPMIMIFYANLKMSESIRNQESVIRSLMGSTIGSRKVVNMFGCVDMLFCSIYVPYESSQGAF